MKIAIVGAGLAGLAAGHFLGRRHEVVIYEASKRPGGLLRSESIDGWTFDAGGSHIIFSSDGRILREMLSLIGIYVGHRRRTFIRYKGRLIEYPFENGIYALPKRERLEILLDFVRNLTEKKEKPTNLLEWFYHVFGRAITEKYLKPYNEKIWKRDLREISLEWVGGRVPNPPVEDVLRSAVGIRTVGYTHQLRFYYPLSGGIETLARALAKGQRILTGCEVKRIEFEDEKPVIEGELFDFAIYTAPLCEVPRIVSGGRAVEAAAEKLDYNSLTVVGIGVRGRVPNIHWLYVPDEDVIFHRLAFLSNYSPNMAPRNCSTIIAEISHREELRNVEDEVLEGLRKIGFDFSVEVCESWYWKYAYVVYNHEYREAVSEIEKFLRERNMIPFGRFGGWEYLNMDAVFRRARELDESVGGHTEQRQRGGLA